MRPAVIHLGGPLAPPAKCHGSEWGHRRPLFFFARKEKVPLYKVPAGMWIANASNRKKWPHTFLVAPGPSLERSHCFKFYLFILIFCPRSVLLSAAPPKLPGRCYVVTQVGLESAPGSARSKSLRKSHRVRTEYLGSSRGARFGRSALHSSKIIEIKKFLMSSQKI